MPRLRREEAVGEARGEPGDASTVPVVPGDLPSEGIRLAGTVTTDERGPRWNAPRRVNPWEWSKAFGFSQAVQVSGAERVLYCSGQTASGSDGAPPTTTDMAEQVTMTFANLSTVLEAAGMTIADVVRLTVYTTDVDSVARHVRLGRRGAGSEPCPP